MRRATRARSISIAEEGVTLDDLLGAAKKQGTEIEKHDIIVLHTGWLNRYYEEGAQAMFPGGFV